MEVQSYERLFQRVLSFSCFCPDVQSEGRGAAKIWNLLNACEFSTEMNGTLPVEAGEALSGASYVEANKFAVPENP
eukprot:1697355-Karenia_brevis.AAC.1